MASFNDTFNDYRTKVAKYRALKETNTKEARELLQEIIDLNNRIKEMSNQFERTRDSNNGNYKIK